MSSNYTHVEGYSPAFRATFINAVKPNTFGDKPKYDIRALFPKDMDLDWYYSMIREVAKINNIADAKGNPTCEYPNFKDGDDASCFTNDTNEQYEGHNNHWWMSYRSSDSDGEPQPFGIVDMAGNTAEAKDLYPGIWLRVCFRLVPYKHEKFGLKIIQRADHIEICGHDTPFASVGGSVDTGKVFANAPAISGLPSNVNQNTPPQAGGAPQASMGPGGGGNTAPQASMGPGGAPQAKSAPQASMSPGPGNAAPTGTPGPGNAGGMSPADYTKSFNNDTPKMGPNAGEYTYEQWQETKQTDDELRANGIIL